MFPNPAHLGRRQILRGVAFVLAGSSAACTESNVEAGRAGQSAQLQPFDDEMVEHCRWFAPSLAAKLGDTKLRAVVNERWQRASSFDFTLRGPIRTFIEMSIMFGSSFDTDPQHPWAGAILRSGGDEMVRAQRLYEGTVAYREKITVWAERRALARWRLSARTPTARGRDELIEESRAEIARIFPEKAAYVGDEGLRALIGEAVTESERVALVEPAHEALMIALFVAIGHGCTHDAIFPAIGDSLRASAKASPDERAANLREAALSLVG